MRRHVWFARRHDVCSIRSHWFCRIAVKALFRTILQVLLRLLGPVLIVVANGLIGFVTYEYLTVLVPKCALPA